MMQSRKTVLDRNKKELVDSINTSNKVYNNEELSILVNQQRDDSKALTNRVTLLESSNLNNRINDLEAKTRDYQNGSLIVRKVPFGAYFDAETKYVVIKLGNLKLNDYKMMMITLKVYSYEYYNTINVSGYGYYAGNIIHTPHVSYLQKSNKIPISFGIAANNDLYLVVHTSGILYVGIWVDEIATMYNTYDDKTSSGWTIKGTTDVSNLRLFPCGEKN